MKVKGTRFKTNTGLSAHYSNFYDIYPKFCGRIFTHKVNYSYSCDFPDIVFIYLPERVMACVLEDEKMANI